jgi:hypothetical protein
MMTIELSLHTWYYIKLIESHTIHFSNDLQTFTILVVGINLLILVYSSVAN